MKPMGGRTWKYWPASGPVFALLVSVFSVGIHGMTIFLAKHSNETRTFVLYGMQSKTKDDAWQLRHLPSEPLHTTSSYNGTNWESAITKF